MAYREPQPLSAAHQLGTFDCGQAALNSWLLRHALQAQGSGSARTYVITEEERLAGYFSLTVGQVDAADAPARVSKGMGRYPIPVMVLSRLAVALQDQGRGVGVGMLQEAIGVSRTTDLTCQRRALHASSCRRQGPTIRERRHRRS